MSPRHTGAGQREGRVMTATLDSRQFKGRFKGPKAKQACETCRKHKMRCVPMEDQSYRCRRCTSRNLTCSFENDKPPAQPSPLPHPSGLLATHADSAQGLQAKEGSVAGVSRRATEFHARSDHFPAPLHFSVPPVDGENALVRQHSFPTDVKDQWHATPMLAMQDLLRSFSSRSLLCENELDLSLDHILSREQIDYLLNIFETRYSPWISLPQRIGTLSPIVILSRCLVASRHLDLPTIGSVVPQMIKLFDAILPKLMSLPVHSTEAIEVFLILSLWSPTGAPEVTAGYDERLRSATAVNMAMNLGLHQESTRFNHLRERQSHCQAHGTMSMEYSSQMNDAQNRTRLWICLSNSESILCLGTGRAPISHRSDDDLHAMETSIDARDVRLSIVSQLFDIAEKALRIRFTSLRHIGSWYNDVSTSLLQLESLYNRILQLSGVADREQPYNQMLQTAYYACRLMTLCNSVRTSIKTLEAEHHTKPVEELLFVDGVYCLPTMAQDIVCCSENILTAVVAGNSHDDDLLCAAPDGVFNMIALAVASLLIVKFKAFQNNASHLLKTPSEALLRQVVERLNHVKCTEDHAPARIAQLIALLLAKWENRHSYDVDVHVAADALMPTFPGTAGLYDLGNSDMNDWSMFTSLDMFMDHEFWNAFTNIYNPNVPASGPSTL